MTRRVLAGLLIDLPLTLAALGASVWLTTRTDRAIEAAINYPSSQWLYDNGDEQRQLQMGIGGFGTSPLKELTPRQQYAQDHPRSPIGWVNGSWLVLAIEQACEFAAERTLPALIVLSLLLGVVIVRRADRPERRRRWGPGRVAAAVGLLWSIPLLINDFFLRSNWFHLGGRGDYHDATIATWQSIAQVVGLAIAAAWLTLFVSGRWRLRGGWREWLGRALGIAWLVMLAWLLVLQPLAQLD